jgi:hypothetical protein
VKIVQLNDETVQLTNGLISRTFTTSPDWGTIDFFSYSTQRSLLRSIQPEAIVSLDGYTFPIGGLFQSNDTTNSYFNRSSPDIELNPKAWHFVSYNTSAPEGLPTLVWNIS